MGPGTEPRVRIAFALATCRVGVSELSQGEPHLFDLRGASDGRAGPAAPPDQGPAVRKLRQSRGAVLVRSRRRQGTSGMFGAASSLAG